MAAFSITKSSSVFWSETAKSIANSDEYKEAGQVPLRTQSLDASDLQAVGNQITGRLSDGATLTASGRNFGTPNATISELSIIGADYSYKARGSINAATLTGTLSFVETTYKTGKMSLTGTLTPGGVISQFYSSVGDKTLKVNGSLNYSSLMSGEYSGTVTSLLITNGPEFASISGGSWSANPLLSADTFDEIIRLTSLGNDSFIGGVSNDYLVISPGTDTVDGGAGFDTVKFSGTYSSYTFSRSSDGSLRVNDTLPGRDGIDTLKNIEKLEFSDITVSTDLNGVAGQAYRIYKAAFNRDPTAGDKKGLGYWISQMDKGMDHTEVAARFIDSYEFQAIYGSNPSNEQFLTKIYQNVLARNPDIIGYNWWLLEMYTNPSKTKAKILSDFAESAENKAAVLTLISTGIPYEPWIG